MNFKRVAVAAALEASAMVRKYYGHVRSVPKLELRRKFTTNAHVSVERILMRRIHNAFPHHGFFSEEFWKSEESARYVWLVDPIDGMMNSLHNIPCFSTTLALVKDESIILGIVANSITQELFIAERGRGSFLNNKRLRVSTTRRLERAVACFGWQSSDVTGKYRARGLRIFNQLARRVDRVRFIGCDPWVLTRIAAGSVDIQTADNTGVNIAAASLVVKEAGGEVTNIHGDELHPFDMKIRRIVVANRNLHGKVLHLLR